MNRQTGSSEYDNFRLNMPETIENMFNVLFNDESWTWTGLAFILVERFGIVDLGELNNAIRAELEKRSQLKDYEEEIE